MPEPRKLRVFLCHSSNDKSAVRELYGRLKAEGWIDPWLDEENLYPGQDWDLEIEKAVEAADAVIVFLSNNSVSKEGYVQRELRFVLRIADFKPEGTVFVIPVRLDDCPNPRRLSMWQYVDYFPEERKDWAYQRLLSSLKVRAGKLGIFATSSTVEKDKQKKESDKVAQIVNGLEAKRKYENNERVKLEKEKLNKAMGELHRENTLPIEVPGNFEQDVQSFATKQSFKRYGVISVFLVGLIGLIFGGTYIFSNLSSAEKPTSTEKVDIPTNTNLATSSPEVSQPTSIPSSTFAPDLPITTLLPTNTPPKNPTIGSTWTQSVDGMKLVYVPAGEFVMGSEDGKEDEKPAHIVYLDAYWIDQTEVTNGMYAKCVEAKACKPPYTTTSHLRDSYYDNVEFDAYPVINVHWDDAKIYCEWANRRLPTEAEWEKAARGTDERIYPWGNIINYSYANYDGIMGDTTSVGRYESGASFYGAYDMAGNVWEWISDLYDGEYYSGSPSSNPSGPVTGSYRLLRGGSWRNKGNILRSFDRNWYSQASLLDSIGFRCALSASE